MRVGRESKYNFCAHMHLFLYFSFFFFHLFSFILFFSFYFTLSVHSYPLSTFILFFLQGVLCCSQYPIPILRVRVPCLGTCKLGMTSQSKVSFLAVLLFTDQVSQAERSTNQTTHEICSM